MLWVTREGCHVDRTGCVWLIKRFIDPKGTFSFFKDPAAEAPEEAELFDVAGARLPIMGRTALLRPFSSSIPFKIPSW